MLTRNQKTWIHKTVSEFLHRNVGYNAKDAKLITGEIINEVIQKLGDDAGEASMHRVIRAARETISSRIITCKKLA